MTLEQFLARFPNATKSTLRANGFRDQDPRPTPVLEPRPEPQPQKPHALETTSAKRVLIRVESVRKRLCDSDNLCAKYHVDCLRIGRIILDDSPDQATIQVCQRKTEPNEPEHTLIQVYELPSLPVS